MPLSRLSSEEGIYHCWLLHRPFPEPWHIGYSGRPGASTYLTGVYMICDGPLLSHGQYLGTVTLCSAFSVLLLSIKVCIFTVNSQLEAEVSSSPSRQMLHLKKSWGMPVLFLSSVIFALGHTVIAYRVRCRARRKHMLHRIDHESVLSSKLLFSSGYTKVPRSPTPTAGRTP